MFEFSCAIGFPDFDSANTAGFRGSWRFSSANDQRIFIGQQILEYPRSPDYGWGNGPDSGHSERKAVDKYLRSAPAFPFAVSGDRSGKVLVVDGSIRGINSEDLSSFEVLPHGDFRGLTVSWGEWIFIPSSKSPSARVARTAHYDYSIEQILTTLRNGKSSAAVRAVTAYHLHLPDTSKNTGKALSLPTGNIHNGSIREVMIYARANLTLSADAKLVRQNTLGKRVASLTRA